MQLAQADAELPQLFTVIAQNQTAGKGQRGNSWFVSPHKNLTYSVFIKTETLSPKNQYAVSELVAVSTLEALRQC